MIDQKRTPARILCTTLVLMSVLQHDVAMAAQGAARNPAQAATPAAAGSVAELEPLREVVSVQTALIVIKDAETRRTEDYFPQGGTLSEVARFKKDLEQLMLANEQIDFIDNLGAFKTWFAANESQLLIDRQKMNSKSLQGFVTEAYVAYRAQDALEKDDASAFEKFLQDKISNQNVLIASAVTITVVGGTLGFIKNTIYGATVAGPIAGSLGAYVEPIVRPFREKLSVIGNKHWGAAGANLNEYLFKDKKSLMDTKAQIDSALESQRATRALIANMGYDMTTTQAAQNFEALKSIWNDANQVWERTNPQAYRLGRAYSMDATLLRPQNFGQNVMIAIAGAETFRQGIETTTDRIKASSSNPAQVDAAVDKLLQEVKKEMHADRANMAGARSRSKQITKAKADLITLGASEAHVARLEANHRRELVFYRHAAASLAGSVLNDLSYPEYNRALPSETAKVYEAFKGNYCIDFFHQEFKAEVADILNKLGIQLSAAKAVVDKNIADIDAKLAETETKTNERESTRSRPAQTEARIETRGHRAVIIPARPIRPAAPRAETARAEAPARPQQRVEQRTHRPQVVPETSSQERAANAIRGVLQSRANQQAARGATELREGAQEQTRAARARAAAARAARH